MTAQSLPAMADGLNFRIGARTVFTLDKVLVRVPLTLDQALDGRLPVLPPLPAGADGYSVTSLPVDRAGALAWAAGGMIPRVRQRYTRYYADLSGGFDAWWGQLSANTRSQTKRKAKKLASASGGQLRVERYRSADELAAFHAIARGVSATTYQERLLDCGLPDDAAFLRDMAARGASGTARGWLLYVGDRPAAYLYCPVDRGTVIYEYVGHDPVFADLSPGAVLHVEAMRDLFEEGGLKRFDFTEGEGQHKRALSTGGVAACDLLLLAPTWGNRAAAAGLAGFDNGVALAKRAVGRLGVENVARRVRRG